MTYAPGLNAMRYILTYATNNAFTDADQLFMFCQLGVIVASDIPVSASNVAAAYLAMIFFSCKKMATTCAANRIIQRQSPMFVFFVYVSYISIFCIQFCFHSCHLSLCFERPHTRKQVKRTLNRYSSITSFYSSMFRTFPIIDQYGIHIQLKRNEQQHQPQQQNSFGCNIHSTYLPK